METNNTEKKRITVDLEIDTTINSINNLNILPGGLNV